MADPQQVAYYSYDRKLYGWTALASYVGGWVSILFAAFAVVGFLN